MRLQRRRRNTTTRRPAKQRDRFLAGRVKTLELLESREMLAGDVPTPWHNSLNPADVNFDQRVSPADAIVVINYLLADGARDVSAAPFAAQDDSQPFYYRDVSGDNRISPLDLLIVVNELLDEKLLMVYTYPTDMADNPITTISVGMDYKLRTEVRDIRDPVSATPGVFAAAADVTFNSSLSSIDTGQSVQFNPFFNEIAPSLLSPGRAIAYGLSGSLTPPGNSTQFLWSVVLTATNAGTQQFTPSFSEDIDHENLLYGINDALPMDEIEFIGTALQIIGDPVVSIGNVTQNEDSGVFNFTVSLSEPATEDIVVAFATSDGTATLANNDYQQASGSVTFTAGQTTRTIPVTVNADQVVEPDEVFNVNLTSVVSGSAEIGTAVGVGTILNDDAQATLAIGNVQRNEDLPGAFNFTVSISGPYTQNVTVNFATSDGTATLADNDYQQTSGTLTFTPGGATTMVIPVTVNADTKVEPNEMFTVTLSNPSVNATIGTSFGVGTIVNDDVLASLSIAPVTVDNVTTGTTTANFTVTLSAATAQAVMVSYATSDIPGSAVAGQDYQATSGTLTFTPGGSLTQTIPVTIIGDNLPDDVDRFLVTLSNPVNAAINVGTATGTINPAVSEPAVSISDVTRFEGASGATTDFVFTVSLAGPSGQQALVAYETFDGTATVANNDYVPTSGTLTFAAGQTTRTATVQVTGDNTAEPNETFTVRVTAVEGATGEAEATGTIVDDDGAPTLVVSDATATPGTGVTKAFFTVTLSGSVTQPVSVGYATANDSAIAGQDYLSVTGNLVFTPGGSPTQVIEVTVLGKSAPQADKTFFMNLSSPSPGNVVIDDGTGVGTIITQGLSISDAVVVEGNSLTSNAVFTVTLSRNLSETVTVFYSTADGTATTGNSDYIATSGTLTFAPDGPQTQVITVSVIGDMTPEANEQFSVNLSNAIGAPVFNATGIGTILNDDGDKVAVRLELADSVTGDPLLINDKLDVGQNFLLRVFITDVQPEPTGIFQSYLDVTFDPNLVEPTGDPDFSAFYSAFTSFDFQTGRLNDFGAFGQLNPPADPSAELLLFEIEFSAIAEGLLHFVGSVAEADLDEGHETLLYFPAPDTPVPSEEINIENRSINIGSNVLTVSNETVSESNNLVFSITRFLPDNTTATVVYSTADGTAVAGQDYLAKSGTLTFVPGEPTTQLVTISVINDSIDEPDETMSLVLSSPVNASLGAPGTGTILDNDGPVTVSVANSSAGEGANLVFTVSLSSVSGKQVVVNYSTANPTSGIIATPGVDYTPTSGTLTFDAGITQRFVTVELLEDILFESSETFRLELSNPVNANLGNSGLGTIIDVPPAGISGFVFVDVNNNGIKEGNEVGIPGAIVTATRQSDGTSVTTTTREDGSYVFVGLAANDAYTVTETQPGFYNDGRDVHNGVESTLNDKYTGIALAPSASESGYNFGERGVRSEFVLAFLNRRAFFASSVVGGVFNPTINMPGPTLNLSSGDIWVSFDGGWDGLRAIEALYNSGQGTVTMRLYNNALQEVAVAAPTATGSVLVYNGQLGQTHFLRLSGSNPNVTVQISDSVVPGAFLAPGDGGGEQNQGGSSSGSNSSGPSNSSSDPFSRLASAQPMTAPVIEPLASSDATDASDEALLEDEDWILESLLA